MTTLAAAVADLTAAPRPVLVLDTCALLDIVRAPLRNAAATVEAGLRLRTLADSGTVRLFVQDIVPGEWADNLPAVRKDGEAGILAFMATWDIAHAFAPTAPPRPALPPGSLIDDLERLAKDLLDAATVLGRDYDGMSLAIDRVAAKRKPASAKGTVKDSHILGHALRLSGLLSAAQYPHRRLLVSSNRADFADANATVFHPQIAEGPDGATAAGLGYAVSLEAAVADLRAAGEIPP